MEISNEILGVIERNASDIKISQDKKGTVSIKITFDPDLDCQSKDGKIFVQELKRQLRLK